MAEIWWETKTKVESVSLRLTDRQANDLYNEVYRIQRDIPGARDAYPKIFAIYDTLNEAGVDGTR